MSLRLKNAAASIRVKAGSRTVLLIVANWLDWWYKQQGKATRSHGCSYSQSWADVQFQRMPNVSLQPGAKDLSWDDLIAATDKGIDALIVDTAGRLHNKRELMDELAKVRRVL